MNHLIILTVKNATLFISFKIFLFNILFFIIIISILFLLKRKKIKESKKILLTIFIIFCLIIALINYQLYNDYKTRYNTEEVLEYFLSINSDTINNKVIVPIFTNKIFINNILQHNIGVVQGNGSIDLVKTKYGDGMQIIFDSNITIRNYIITGVHNLYYTGDYSNSISMETQNGWWIYYEPSNNTNPNCVLFIFTKYDSGFLAERKALNTKLNNDWNLYDIYKSVVNC